MNFKETFDLNNGMASWPSLDTKPSSKKPITFTPAPKVEYQESTNCKIENYRNANVILFGLKVVTEVGASGVLVEGVDK